MGVDKIKVSVRFDQLFKGAVKSENDCRSKWKRKYYWLASEYLKLHNEIEEISNLKLNTNVVRKENRSLKPVPPTENGVYGWVASRKEFQLQIYGTDILNTIPIPKDDILSDDL